MVENPMLHGACTLHRSVCYGLRLIGDKIFSQRAEADRRKHPLRVYLL